MLAALLVSHKGIGGTHKYNGDTVRVLHKLDLTLLEPNIWPLGDAEEVGLALDTAIATREVTICDLIQRDAAEIIRR